MTSKKERIVKGMLISEYRKKYNPEYRQKNLERLKAYNKAWRLANPNYDKEWERRDPIRTLLRRAKTRATKYGKEFTITINDIKFCPLYCPITNVKLQYGGVTRARFNSASLDRIDNTKGYIPGNVWIISHAANSMKSNGTELKGFNNTKLVEAMKGEF